jgi:hypothetical protein
MKPDRYKEEDWQWLIDRYEARLNHWCNKWLSMGGRLVLIKVVLESLPVYWMSLAHLSISILNKIRRLSFTFLWSGNKNKKSYHLCSWVSFKTETLWWLGVAQYFYLLQGSGIKYSLAGLDELWDYGKECSKTNISHMELFYHGYVLQKLFILWFTVVEEYSKYFTDNSPLDCLETGIGTFNFGWCDAIMGMGLDSYLSIEFDKYPQSKEHPSSFSGESGIEQDSTVTKLGLQ